MYKVKDAADQLGVTRVEIFEILLSQRELFDPYVVKKNSITYISDEGMSLLKSVIKGNEATVISKGNEELTSFESNLNVNLDESVLIEDTLLVDSHPNEPVIEFTDPVAEVEAEVEVEPLLEEVESDSIDASEPMIIDTFSESPEEQEDTDSEDEVFSEEDMDHLAEVDLDQITGDFFATIQENPSVSKIESDDLLVGLWLKEIQSEDEQAIQLDSRLKEIRGQVTGLRNKILVLDSEIKRKDEAIKHYHEIMKDDLRWLEDMERKVQLIVKNQLAQYSAEESIEQVPENIADEDKGNFFKFFKR